MLQIRIIREVKRVSQCWHMIYHNYKTKIAIIYILVSQIFLKLIVEDQLGRGIPCVHRKFQEMF